MCVRGGGRDGGLRGREAGLDSESSRDACKQSDGGPGFWKVWPLSKPRACSLRPPTFLSRRTPHPYSGLRLGSRRRELVGKRWEGDVQVKTDRRLPIPPSGKNIKISLFWKTNVSSGRSAELQLCSFCGKNLAAPQLGQRSRRGLTPARLSIAVSV